MPKAQQTAGARQRPVSCRFCRSRKLRCSREAPCSNCVSRGFRCELEYPTGSPSRTLGASEAELVERIRKLEELVGNQKSQPNESMKESAESSDIHAEQAHSLTQSPQIEYLDNDVAWLESFYSDQTFSVNILCLQQ
jgi:Fungal Zn(2)-Cys(6) binuclear cluster domain